MASTSLPTYADYRQRRRRVDQRRVQVTTSFGTLLGATRRLTLDALGAERRPSVHIPDGRPAVLAFWRSDCAPCLIELGEMALLKRAAGSLRLFWVALEPALTTRQTLSRRAFPAIDIYTTDTDAAQALVAFGGAPPRLPLAVLIDGRGRVLDGRRGLLGADIIRSWARQCSR